MDRSQSDADQLSPLQKSFFLIQQLESNLEAMERAKTEPIAIIGMACRFPGGANSPDAFWQLLRDGRDAITEIAADRWPIDTYYDPDPDALGKMYTRYGGFLSQIDHFDPQFFGMSPREAMHLDPQQRLLLEVSWEALEHAGQAPQQLAGSATGIFVGIGQTDYAQLQLLGRRPADLNAYTGTGNGLCFASGRLSYVLGLQGPSMAIDTACSSSLVATHLACQSLRARECNLALAGGVQLILSPEVTIVLSRMHALSPDGRCKAFDAAADGFGRGEGCGVIVLKRLTDAVADGDNILALIRGAAVNHDGASSGLTVPNGLSQQRLIRQALERAQVHAEHVSYVETHGTGTALGDPIEVEALGAVFGKDRPQDHPLIIGSVKTNVGHLEAAAGIVALIKVVLALQNEEIPPHLHFNQPNPHIPWDELPVMVPTARTPWPVGISRRLAGVSSFGMSGTNVHVVLEEAPVAEPKSVGVERPLHLLTLSAKTEAALQQMAKRYEVYLKAHPDVNVADVCFTANTGRSHFQHRLSVVAESATQVQEALAACLTGQETHSVITGQVQRSDQPKVAFLFTGQGSQYVEMGRHLYETQLTFRRTLERCDELLRPCLEHSLLAVLYPAADGPGVLDATAYTQPALFALEYALAELWRSWGITPEVVMGHSVGEYVAACVAGVFSVEEGLQLIAARGRLMQALPQDGDMVVVLADVARVTAAIAPHAAEVSLAAINGAAQVVVSGRRQAVQAVVNALEAEGVKTRKLTVSHAFHSPLMEPMLAAFEQAARAVTFAAPRIDLLSNVSGGLATADIATPAYWCRHVHAPVRFAESLAALQQRGADVLIEIGPQPILLGLGRQCLPDADLLWLPSLRRGHADWQVLLQSVAALYQRGVSIDWHGFDQDYVRRKVVLPTYTFQRQRYWMAEPENRSQPAASLPQEQAPTSVVNLINQGDIKQLGQELEETGAFSDNEAQLLPKLLAVLADRHQQQLATAAVKDCFYKLEWQLKPRHPQGDLGRTRDRAPGCWLIFADRGGVGQALAERLQECGQSPILIYGGDRYETSETGIWHINPDQLADYQRLLQAMLQTGACPVEGVVHLWGVETGPPALTISSLEQAQTWGCGSVLHLLQALVKAEGAGSPRLWLVTRGAVPAGRHPAPLSVAQAPLWGLGKVIALEHPEVWGGLLDLDPHASGQDHEVAMLLTELWEAAGEDQVAFRDQQRYVVRLLRDPQRIARGMRVRADGSYLITGGLGALGLQVARWLLDRGAQYLVLSGRRGVSSGAVQEAVDQLQQAGAQVHVAPADVSCEADMVRVFDEIQATMPPLRGLVHAAGVSGYQAVKDIEPTTLAAMLRPKVMGTWLLHQLTQGMALDFFVGFSSIASVWGAKGLGHYAAANQFLDTVAHHRHDLGLPAMSVNWGPWSGGGMASAELRQWLGRMGVQALPPQQAMAALDCLLGADVVQATVARVDWPLFKGVYEARAPRPLLEQIEIPPRSSAPQPQVQQSDILRRLEAAPTSDRHALLMAYIQAEVVKVLGLEPSQLPEPQQGFFEMGMDSLMAVELKNRLEVGLCASFPSTLAFDSPTIAHLTEYLGREVLGWDTAAVTEAELPTGENNPAKALSEVEQLSEDEVEASIAQGLAKLEMLLRQD